VAASRGCGTPILRRWLVAIVAAGTSCGEPDADLAGFGGPDGGVAGEGFLPVVLGLTGVAVVLVGAGEAAVRAGLFPWGADLGRELKSGGVVSACLSRFTRLGQNVTEAVERASLHPPIADLAKPRQGLLKVLRSLLVAAKPQISLTELA
jgi:hypothetical protein